MGEYAKYRGAEIKLGTCENLYYLRADQRDLIEGYDFSPDVFRYRFPFPDEDQLEPGHFDDYDRGVRIPGWRIPAEFADGHHSVQFTSRAGYVLSIPCPEGKSDAFGLGPVDVDGLMVHRNGFNGHAVVRQQRRIGDELLTVVACNACGGAWRLPRETATEVAEAFLNEAEREEYRRDLDAWGPANSETHRKFLLTIAERILAGYVREEAASR